jgi:hypothetical protein
MAVIVFHLVEAEVTRELFAESHRQISTAAGSTRMDA